MSKEPKQGAKQEAPKRKDSFEANFDDIFGQYEGKADNKDWAFGEKAQSPEG